MTTPTDVLAGGRRHLVTTASGARYVVDARDERLGPTITRLTHGATDTDGRFPMAELRRDGQPIRVIAIEYVDGGAARAGVVVGLDMLVTLEPLAIDASYTVRRTTPVVRVEVLSDSVDVADV